MRRGNEPISVIPVDIQALCRAPLPPPPLMVDSEAAASSTTTQPPPRKRPRVLEQNSNGHSEAAAAAAVTDAVERRARKQTRAEAVLAPAKGDAIVAATNPTVEGPILPSDDEIRTAIMNALERVEAKEPWKQAFNFADMSMPFDSPEKYPKLVVVLQEFWETCAQAVWERQFWAPLSRERYHELHTLRRGRQSRAQNSFEKNIIPLVYKEFGAAFFVRLDQSAERHCSWYYLDQVVDLFTLAQRCGLATCLKYIESEAFTRFPVAPGVTRNFFLRANGKVSACGRRPLQCDRYWTRSSP